MRCLQRDSVERDGAPVRIRRVAVEVDKMARETPNESACAGDMNTAPGAQPREAHTGIDQTLRESEAHWREVFEHNPVMYFMVDADGIVQSVNGFGAAQLGYRVDELVGQSVLGVFQEEDRPFVLQQMRICLADPGRSHNWEVRKIRKDGSLLWVRENAKAVRRPDGFLVLVACEDITERRRTEDALRQSEMYLAEAQRISHTGSFGWRISSGELIWSAETYRIFECDPSVEPTVELALQRMHPDDREFVRQLLERVTLDRTDWDVEHRLLMSDGRVKDVRAVAHAVRDGAGNFEFIGVVMDVTASRKAAQELSRARAELAHVMRVTTLGELAAAIAHEVNQPIAAMVTDAQASLNWLGREPADLGEVDRALRRIVDNGNRAADVIGRIRELVKKAPPRMGLVDLNLAVKEMIALTRAEISGSGVALETALENDLPPVYGDRVQLQQVLLNLIVNALQAMSAVAPEQRRLRVSTARVEPDRVRVSVQDSGPGLSAALVDRIFAPFYSTKPDGLGMGLSICRSIVEAHDGRLWASAEEPGGAVFHFTIPVDSDR
jgi:PAS domain S-box-containing protein